MTMTRRVIRRRPRTRLVCLPEARRYPQEMRIPGNLFVALKTNAIGVVIMAVGPFVEKEDAEAYAAEHFGSNGYVSAFRLSFRRP